MSLFYHGLHWKAYVSLLITFAPIAIIPGAMSKVFDVVVKYVIDYIVQKYLGWELSNNGYYRDGFFP